MKNIHLPNLEQNPEFREQLLPYCRLKPGEVWEDPQGKHKIGCLDATNEEQVSRLMGCYTAHLAIHDPPYNLVVFEERPLTSMRLLATKSNLINFSKQLGTHTNDSKTILRFYQNS